MIKLIYCDPSFTDQTVLVDYQTQFALNGKVILVNSLSELEQKVLSGTVECLLFLTLELTPIQLIFIERLMVAAPLPIIVNVRQWQTQVLSGLLNCGRITFVPDELSSHRLPMLINLAQARFTAASSTLASIQKLDNDIRIIKVVTQAKLVLMQQGITESTAHQLIQQQAMKKGLSVENMANQIIDTQQAS